MVALQWILWIGGGLFAIVYIAFVAFVAYIAFNPRVLRIEPMDDNELNDVLELAPVAREFAEAQGWHVAVAYRLLMPGVDRREVYWAIEPNGRFFGVLLSSLEPDIVKEGHDFLTLLKPRSGGGPVRVVSSTRLEDLDGPGDLGFISEAFPGLDLHSLAERHDAAVAHTIQAGDCRPAEHHIDLGEVTLRMLRAHLARLRRNPLRLIGSPVHTFWLVITQRNRSVADRFPAQCRTMRQSRGEIMTWPQTYA